MFLHFEKFNPLFIRPRIRAAIKDYQVSLIDNVKVSVTAIQEKFLKSYDGSATQTLANLRDIPPFAGKIMWARLLENQLDLLTTQMEQVLGKGWEQEVEGRLLKKTCSEVRIGEDTSSFATISNFLSSQLKAKLNSDQSFKKWRKDWEKELIVSRNKERLSSYLIRIENTSNKSKLIARCNYETKTIEVSASGTSVRKAPAANTSVALSSQLFKEVRNLKWLGFDIPPTIQRMADEAFRKYPNAMKLNATLRSYTHTRSLIDEELNLSVLVDAELSAIQDSVKEAFNTNAGPTTTRKAAKRVNWDSPNIKEWVANFSELVFVFQEKVRIFLPYLMSLCC